MSDRWETQAATPLPEGVVVQHTLYGEPQSQYLRAHTAPIGAEAVGVQPSPFSHIEYEPEQPPKERDRAKLCIANDGACKGYRVTDSEYCMSHDPEVRAKAMAAKRALGQ